MMQEIQHLLDEYQAWLKAKTEVRQIGQWVEITTPYVDRHNDCVQLYVQKTDTGFILTDDGYTIGDLEQSGCKLDSPKRQRLLQMTLNGFGVKEESNRLELHASKENFALRKHNLIQAMLAVNDLFYLASPSVTSLFLEDVEAWLDMHDIRYTPKVKFTGTTGFDYMFDFVIPKSRVMPERILKVANRPEKNTAQNIVLSWVDTREVRPPDSMVYAILNDSEKKVKEPVIEALDSYNVKPVLWSEREKFQEQLAA